nr:AAA family ATPase [uncultured Porphyromonas sp.]
MVESIHIKNIGPLRDVRIDPITPVTLLIGASASGKSTIMKLLVLMRYIYKLVNIRSYLRDANIERAPFKIQFKSLLQDDLGALFQPSSYIEYSVRTERHSYQLRYEQGKLHSNVHVQREDLVFFKESFIAETRGSIAFDLDNRVSRRAGLGFFYTETLNGFNQAISHIPERSLPYLGMWLRYDSKQKKYWITSKDAQGESSYTIPFTASSSGVQSTAPMSIIFQYQAQEFSFKEAFKRSVLTYLFIQDRLSKFSPSIELSELPRYIHLYIEEPELSLNPAIQRKLMRHLLRQAFVEKKDDRTLGLMIATHSPYIVNDLNVLMYDPSTGLRPEYVSVYKVEDGGITSLMAKDDERGLRIVDTMALTQPMLDIYDDYRKTSRL